MIDCDALKSYQNELVARLFINFGQTHTVVVYIYCMRVCFPVIHLFFLIIINTPSLLSHSLSLHFFLVFVTALTGPWDFASVRNC